MKITIKIVQLINKKWTNKVAHTINTIVIKIKSKSVCSSLSDPYNAPESENITVRSYKLCKNDRIRSQYCRQ